MKKSMLFAFCAMFFVAFIGVGWLNGSFVSKEKTYCYSLRELHEVRVLPSFTELKPVQIVDQDVPVLKAQVNDTQTPGGFMDWIKSNYVSLVWGFMGFIEILVRLTPTQKDNSIFNLLKNILDALLPNRKDSGGLHT